MSELAVGAIAFICIFGGAVFGMVLGPALPEHYRSAESNDIIKVATAMIATLAALVLGLLVASAKSSFDSKDSELIDAAAQVVLLDRTLAAYGPETKETRDLLRQTIAIRLSQIWPDAETATPKAIGEGAAMEGIQRRIQDLPAQSDTQHWVKSAALQISSNIAAARWTLLEHTSSTVQWPLLAILVSWLVAIFLSFGLFAPRNGGVIAALFVSALSVAGSIYLILEMDQPYSGLIKFSSAPLRIALEQLGRQ
jgi:hypothetical protein